MTSISKVCQRDHLFRFFEMSLTLIDGNSSNFEGQRVSLRFFGLEYAMVSFFISICDPVLGL